jgi:hypothetical protein
MIYIIDHHRLYVGPQNYLASKHLWTTSMAKNQASNPQFPHPHREVPEPHLPQFSPFWFFDSLVSGSSVVATEEFLPLTPTLLPASRLPVGLEH